MQDNIYSVTEVNNYIKGLLDRSDALRNVQVAGEISNFKRYPSGHCYFTLKDAGALLKCVMFRGKALGLRFEPKNGDTVLAIGRISVYERDGVYQLYTDLLLQQGQGNLMLAYEKLKARLAAQGLFDEERKRPLPVNPGTVGVITSPAGAAVRDIITVSRRRDSGIKLLLYPVKVQGEGAAAEIAAAIRFFNKEKLADVLIVGRGGGSLEDLWAFNEEAVVKAVAASRIPVVSAVGHETDFTLCDFAADKRAATPSQAAELAVADNEGYRQHIRHLEKRLYQLFSQQAAAAEHRLQVAMNSWALRDPERLVEVRSQRVDSAWQKLRLAMEKTIAKREHGLQLQAARLDSLSPLAVMGRGYSIAQKEDYSVINSVEQIGWGEELMTTVQDGTIISVVQSVERREPDGN